MQCDSKAQQLSEKWEDTRQGEPNFHPGHKESQAHGIHVQNNGTLLKGLWRWIHQWHTVLHYQHQWELEQKKTEDAEMPKIGKNNWATTMENLVLHLRFVRGMRGTLLAYVVWCYVKVDHIASGHDTYLNLDEKMITRAPIVDTRSNLKMSQETLDRVVLSYEVDTFKIDNALLHQIISKVFTYMDAYVYVK